MNWARANRGKQAAEELHWPAHQGQGPEEAVHRRKLEQDQPRRSEPGRRIGQFPPGEGSD